MTRSVNRARVRTVAALAAVLSCVAILAACDGEGGAGGGPGGDAATSADAAGDVTGPRDSAAPADASQPRDAPEPVDVPGMADGTGTPDVPAIPDATETPDVPALPDTPVTPDVPSPDVASPDVVSGDCASLCALALGCADVPDRDALFGLSQAECESRCGGPMEDYVRDCVLAAADCAALTECTRCQTWDDLDFCQEGACGLLVDSCGGSDYDQCTIDCEMIGSGAMGCFRAAGGRCWRDAVTAQSCDLAARCPMIH